MLDLVDTLDGKKAPTPAELARRFPLKPARPFTVAHGARRLFAPEAAAVAYLDGRRHAAAVASARGPTTIAASCAGRAPSDKARMLAKQRARDKRCALWSRAPSTFDDVGLALTAAPDGLSLTWAWGTESGAPLGGLKLHAVDDAGLDAELLGRDATAVVALYAASLAPFAALKRTAPFASAETLSTAIDGCDTMAGADAAGALVAAGDRSADRGEPSDAVAAGGGAAKLWLAAQRRLSRCATSRRRGRAAPSPRPSTARRAPLLETLARQRRARRGAVTPIGKRSPTVYPLNIPGFPRQLAAGARVARRQQARLHARRLGRVADVGLSHRRAAGRARPAADDARAKPPLLRVAADLATLSKLGPLLNAGRDEQQLLDLLARLRRVDGELVADGDLLRLTLRSPLKQ